MENLALTVIVIAAVSAALYVIRWARGEEELMSWNPSGGGSGSPTLEQLAAVVAKQDERIEKLRQAVIQISQSTGIPGGDLADGIISIDDW